MTLKLTAKSCRGNETRSRRAARVDDVQVDTQAKGAAIGKQLREAHAPPREICILHYDPLSGVDLDVLLAGVASQVEAPIPGGAAKVGKSSTTSRRTCSAGWRGAP